MKRLNFIAAAAALILATGCDETRSTTSSGTYSTSNMAIVSAPDNVQSRFVTRYPGATNVSWYYYDNTTAPIDWDLTDWQVLTPKDYTVTYDLNGSRYYSWYDTNGNWIGTSYNMDANNTLPALVNNTISNQFPGYTISNIRNESWRDRNAYQVELTNSAMRVKLLVDANGTILKQKSREL